MSKVSHFSAVSSTLGVVKKTFTAGATSIAISDQDYADIGILEVTTVAGALTVIMPRLYEGKLITASVGAGTSTITFKTATSAGTAVAPSKTAILRCTDTDIVRVTADA